MSKKSKTITTRDVLAFHWGYAKRFPKLAWISLLVQPATVLVRGYVAPIIIAVLLLEIQNGTVSLSNSWWMIVAYIGIQIISSVIGSRISLYAMWGLQVSGSSDIYKESYERLTKQSLDFYNNNFTGSLVSRVSKLANAFMNFWNTIIYEFLPVSVSVLATLIATAFMVWQYSVVLAILITLYAVVAYFGTKFMRERQKERSKAYTKISAQLSDSISNMLAVKIDSNEAKEVRRFNKAIGNMADKEKSVRSGFMRISTSYGLIVVAMQASALLASIWAVQTGVANAAIVYLALTYTFNLIQEMHSIVSIMRSMYQITGDSEEMLETFNENVAVSDVSNKKLKVKNGEIFIDNLSFKHDDDSDNLFTNLTLKIPAGQRVGVVGVSGSGKTTLTKLLLRFVNPSAGSIKIDGVDISKITQNSLHDNIAYVPQEPLLFHRSVLENIGYSKNLAKKADIINASKQAYSHQFIEKLKDGYDTLVGERGVKLSGGQRQRVSIARAILKNAPILILDEATSALDSESEQYIQKGLAKLMKGRTSIVIAHRLSTISKLDRIIVLDNGSVIEDGTHEQLLKKKGSYAKLWSHQSGGFLEE